MGKSARANNIRLAELKAAAAREERRRRLLLAAGTLGVIVVVVAALVFAALRAPQKDSASATALDPAAASALTSVPPATLDAIGAGTATNPAKKIDAPALTKDGKPRVLYVGAEYCPYCAAERWPFTVALSRFGTWSNLRATTSAPAPEPNPETPTVSFHGASYTSQYISFTGYETATNKKVNAQYEPLDTLSAEDQALFTKYNAPPYVSGGGGIPWVNYGGTAVSNGASIPGELLLGKTHTEIATALADPNSPIAKAVDGSANVITAQICKLTNNQPGEVCTSKGVTAAAAKLQ